MFYKSVIIHKNIIFPYFENKVKNLNKIIIIIMMIIIIILIIIIIIITIIMTIIIRKHNFKKMKIPVQQSQNGEFPLTQKVKNIADKKFLCITFKTRNCF